MVLFKDILKKTPALQFLFENLRLASGIGRDYMLNQPFITDSEILQKELNNVAFTCQWLENKDNQTYFSKIIHLLSTINDIKTTISRLSSEKILDDIELFEIKKFALTVSEIIGYLNEGNFHILNFESLSEAVALLDPENSKIPHFYIYALYDERLTEIRKRITNAETDTEAEHYHWQCTKIEDQVRTKLSEKLISFASQLSVNLTLTARLDMLLAKAQLATQWVCCLPKISDTKNKYKALFHPITKNRLGKEGKQFQYIDIELFSSPCLITGANMSGKTIFLKTVAFAQYMFQFAFFVPAKEAEINIVEDIYFCSEEIDPQLSGLSSFALEILTIDHLIKQVKEGRKLLILVDEPARTTNPTEGRALVSALTTILVKHNALALVTTHYAGVHTNCRRLRVKGLEFEGDIDHITPQNINQYMNYQLVETENEEVPHEALKIAEILKVDRELLEIAIKEVDRT